MEKEIFVVDDSDTPKSILPAKSSSVDSLSLSVGNLSLIDGESSSVGRIKSLGFNGDHISASSRTQETQETSSDIQEIRLKHSRTPLPTPLDPFSIWAVNNSTNNGGNHPGSNFQLEAIYSEPLVNNGNYRYYQEGQDKSCLFRQDSTPGMQNQESFNNVGEVKTKGSRFIEFATTPLGSKSLQDILASRNPVLTSQILERVTATVDKMPVICYLMLNKHGCYVCSKLIDECNAQQLALILNFITRYNDLFVQVSCNIHGSKLIKKLIKTTKNSSLIRYLTVSIYMGFYDLMINGIGLYVVIFCLDYVDVKLNELLYEAVVAYCLVLSTQVVGCIAVNNFIDRIQGSHRQTLLELISDNTVFLSQDPSGNHVMQKVLGLENPIFSARIGSKLRGHYARLSMQKWGSHVVEKCLSSQAMIYAVEDLLICSSSQLLQIARDQFGNYVIQKALRATKKWNNALHLRLLKSLEPTLNDLQNGYARNVYSLIINGVPVEEPVNKNPIC